MKAYLLFDIVHAFTHFPLLGGNEDEGSAHILHNAGSVHSLLSSSRGSIPVPHICGQTVLLLVDSILLSTVCVGRKLRKMSTF